MTILDRLKQQVKFWRECIAAIELRYEAANPAQASIAIETEIINQMKQ